LGLKAKYRACEDFFSQALYFFTFKNNGCAFLRNCFLLKILGGEEGF